MEQIRFSYFNSPINVMSPATSAISLEELFDWMRGDLEEFHETSLEAFKTLSGAARIDSSRKKELPYVTFSSEFEPEELRRLNSSFKHTGLFVMDIDKIPNAQDIYYKSTKWKHTVMSFISPSGKGVKIIVKADLTENQIKDFGHAVVCSQMIDLVEGTFGVSVDPLKDSTRACFVCSSEEVFLNLKADPITVSEDDLRNSLHEINTEEVNHEAPETPIKLQAMIMRVWKGCERRLGRFPEQARYSWLVSFVTECHKKGIDRGALLRFMGGYVLNLPQMDGLSAFDLNDYTNSLTKKVYSKYSNEFGMHYEWFLNNSARYQYPIDELGLGTARVADVAAYAAENFTEFMYHNAKFWKFDGRIFQPIDEETDKDFIVMIQAITPSDRPSVNKQLVTAMKSYMYAEPASIKGLPKVLFLNGVLDTTTWKFRHYTEAELLEAKFTFEFGFNYNEKVNDKTWNKMVKRVMLPNEKLDKSDDSDAKERLLYDFLGYSLFGNGQAEQVLLFTGKGANGKSSLINTIMDMFPKNIIESVAPKQFGDRFTGANLVGKILNIVPDIDYSDLGNEASFKKIVSNETVTIEEKYKKPWSASLFCSHIFAANGDLQFKNNDNALDRRFLTVLLEQVFYAEDRDHTLKDKLKSEEVYQTIFNQAVEGWKRYQDNNHKFVVPDSSVEAQKERVKELDHTRSFFDTCLVPEEGASCSLKDVQQAYEDWCMANNLMRSDRIPFNKLGGKLREYVQYESPKSVKITKPQNRLKVNNATIAFDPDMQAASEMVDEGMSFIKGIGK